MSPLTQGLNYRSACDGVFAWTYTGTVTVITDSVSRSGTAEGSAQPNKRFQQTQAQVDEVDILSVEVSAEFTNSNNNNNNNNLIYIALACRMTSEALYFIENSVINGVDDDDKFDAAVWI